MNRNAMFGAFFMLALIGSTMAQPSDYNLYKRTGACLRYIGPEMDGYNYGAAGGLYDYEEVNFGAIQYPTYQTSGCPLTNGVPTCAV